MPHADCPEAAPKPGFRLLINHGPTVLEAGLCDMNAEVARVLVDRPVVAGTVVALLGRRGSSPSPCALAARVTHSAPWDSGRWLVRCVFLNKLRGEELEALLD